MLKHLFATTCAFLVFTYIIQAQDDGIIDKRLHRHFTSYKTTSSIDNNSEVQKINELKGKLDNIGKKLSSDLLQVIDGELLPGSVTSEEHVHSMESLKQIRLNNSKSAFNDRVKEGDVYVYINLKDGYSISAIKKLTTEITDYDKENNIAVAWVKVKNLETIVALENVNSVRTVLPPVTYSGSVTTEGDVLHTCDLVRSNYSSDGTGIKVGVISDGVSNWITSRNTGDLPSSLNVLSAGSGDEGTAMLEIIYDLAPGADLYFHDAGANATAFNTAIDNLVAAGCNVIVDDIGWLTQPFYEDGTIASHLSSVLSSNDIIYVSACGNAGDSHYQGDFYPTSGATSRHDFSEGTSSYRYLYVNLDQGENVIVVLQWDDQFGASNNDYDLYLRRYSDNQLVASSIGYQTGTQDPLESLSYTKSTSGNADYYIQVVKYGSAQSKNLEVFIYPGSGAYNYIDNITSGDGIYGHAAVDEVVSVGAVDVSNPNTIEYFSSNGPSTIQYPVYEVRQTPKVVGADFVSVTGAGGFPTSFGGTSASSAHIAGVLALVWSGSSESTASEIKQALFDWTDDLGSTNYDNTYGYGLADANKVFENAFPLPVELNSFTASVTENGIELNWITVTEVNNYGFEVQRSTNEKNWQLLGFIQGSGNSNSPHQYSYFDSKINFGKYSYRLKQIDNDGSFEYSDIVNAHVGVIPGNFVLEQNYPNPFNPATVIRFAVKNSELTSLKVFNVLGKEVATLFKGVAESGRTYEVKFDGSDLPSGLYFYSLKSTSFSSTKKMLLLK